MAFVQRTMIFFLATTVLKISMATVYKVGDSSGWTAIGNVDYNKWATNNTFHLGDIILFKYNTEHHNVMEVSGADYRTCNYSSPIATYTTGNDSITIKEYGHHYFLCGFPNHCNMGQKVDIRVLSPSSSSSMEPSPSTPSSTLAPPTPKSTASHSEGRCRLFFIFTALFYYAFAF